MVYNHGIQNELLKKCLQNRIAMLREHIYWRVTGHALEGAEAQLEYCRRMLIDPSKLGEEEKVFLLTEYAHLV